MGLRDVLARAILAYAIVTAPLEVCAVALLFYLLAAKDMEWWLPVLGSRELRRCKSNASFPPSFL